MLMQSIRRGAKKYRVLAIIVVALIVISLVLSFGMSGSNNDNNSVDNKAQLLAQAEYLERSIAEQEADTGAAKDYSYYSNLAGSYSSLAYAYYQLENSKSTEAYLKAAENYELALNNAPENLNETGKGLLYVDIANNYYYAGDDEKAVANYELARAIIPEEWSFASAYSVYLFNKQVYTEGMTGTREFLTDYMELVKDDADKVESAQNQLDYLQALYDSIMEYFQNLSDSTDANTDTGGEGTGSGEPDDHDHGDADNGDLTPDDGDTNQE